jgi:hypothetical protein
MRQIQALDVGRSRAAWNLYWLSNPGLDKVLEDRTNWWAHYQAVEGGLVAVIDDITEDDTLYRKVTAHPAAFLRWFSEEDQSIFDSYTAYGRRRWVSNVLARAEEAAQRLERRRTERLIA